MLHGLETSSSFLFFFCLFVRRIPHQQPPLRFRVLLVTDAWLQYGLLRFLLTYLPLSLDPLSMTLFRCVFRFCIKPVLVFDTLVQTHSGIFNPSVPIKHLFAYYQQGGGVVIGHLTR